MTHYPSKLGGRPRLLREERDVPPAETSPPPPPSRRTLPGDIPSTTQEDPVGQDHARRTLTGTQP